MSGNFAAAAEGIAREAKAPAPARWNKSLRFCLLMSLPFSHGCSPIGYDAVVIRRFYVHNFRCLENFELNLAGRSSTLLIGNNGSGKSTVALALEVLQKIARGSNRLSDLLNPC